MNNNHTQHPAKVRLHILNILHLVAMRRCSMQNAVAMLLSLLLLELLVLLLPVLCLLVALLLVLMVLVHCLAASTDDALPDERSKVPAGSSKRLQPQQMMTPHRQYCLHSQGLKQG